jgi:hypothetical protein
MNDLLLLHERRCQTFALFERLLKSRLQDEISDAAYAGKANELATSFAAISVAVRELQARNSSLGKVIDRLQSHEQEHWKCVLELHRVELALNSAEQRAASAAVDNDENETHHVDAHSHGTCSHVQHNNNDNNNETNDDDDDEVHALHRIRSELIDRRNALREEIQDLLDDARE